MKMHLTERQQGALWVVLSALGFGAMAIFAKVAYQGGVDLNSLLFLRFLIAGAFLAGVVFWRGLPWPQGPSFRGLVAMGGVGYVGQAACFFLALQYASAGTVGLLLYLYPAMVAIIDVVLTRQGLPWVKRSAIGVALLGLALTVVEQLAARWLGIVLGVGAAVIYSIYITAGARFTRGQDPLAAAAVVMLAAAVVFGLLVLVNGPVWPSTALSWAAVVAIALFSTVLGMVGFFIGLRHLGAVDASTLSTLEPVVTLLLAAWWLGEGLSVIQMLGAALILGAVVVLVRSGSAASENAA